jgi:hypothetical protein
LTAICVNGRVKLNIEIPTNPISIPLVSMDKFKWMPKIKN